MTVILSRKIQKGNKFRKVLQKLYILFLKKSKFCKSSFAHHLELLQK